MFGAIGFFLAWSGLHNAGTKYNNFLLIIAYWIGPGWRSCSATSSCAAGSDRGRSSACSSTGSTPNWAGPVAMAVGAGVSIWLFANQTEYVGLVPKHIGSAGDLTFEVGFVLTAVIYLTWRLIADRSSRAALATEAHAHPV